MLAAVGAGVSGGVAVATVAVTVAVDVGGEVGAGKTSVVTCATLLLSLNSITELFGSTVPVFVSVPPAVMSRTPVLVLVALPLGPVRFGALSP